MEAMAEGEELSIIRRAAWWFETVPSARTELEMAAPLERSLVCLTHSRSREAVTEVKAEPSTTLVRYPSRTPQLQITELVKPVRAMRQALMDLLMTLTVMQVPGAYLIGIPLQRSYSIAPSSQIQTVAKTSAGTCLTVITTS